MSQPEFLILGDSNVKRFYTKLGITQAKNICFVTARNLNEVSTAMTAINDCYKFVVLAFVTNLIVDAGDVTANDVDRISAIEEMFNTIVPLIQ